LHGLYLHWLSGTTGVQVDAIFESRLKQWRRISQSLIKLLDNFINDYLAANPKEQPVSMEEKDKKPKDN
jgi:hypothetical protein